MWLVPLALKFQKFIAQGTLVLFGFVRVQLAVRFWIRLGVGIGWVRHEGVRWPMMSWGYSRGSLMAVNTETALAWHFDELWGRTGRGS